MPQALRVLRRSPWYAATIVGAVALAMALATTVFAVVDGVLFKPLPYPEAGQLYAIQAGINGLPRNITPGPSANDIAAWTRALPDIAITGFRVQPWMGFGSGINDNDAGVATVQRSFFDVMRVQPLLGGFSADDFTTDTTFVPVLMMYDVWQHRFGGDPAAIGRSVNLTTTGTSGYRIVGVMPPGFVFPTDRWDVSFLKPALSSQAASRSDLRDVVARVPTADAAAALTPRLEAAMRECAAAQPPRGPKPAGWSDANWRAEGPLDQAAVTPLSVSIGQKNRPFLNSAFIAVLVLVLLGAINASALMAARAIDRQAEFDVRRALGAGGLAIARLVIGEALTLITIGASLGLALAPMLLDVVRSLLPEDLVLLRTPAVDWRVAGFVVISILVMTVPAAAWPMWRTVRHTRLGRAAERGVTGTRSTGRHVVIAGQVAGAFALTVIGALLVQSLLAVYANGHPIRTDGIVLLEAVIDDEAGAHRPSAERAARVATARDRLRQAPGVRDVAVTGAQVLRGGNWVSRFEPPKGAASPRMTVDLQSVTADYYRLVQPQLIAGRLPTDEELASDARVVVVSESVARGYWPRVSPVGQRITQSRDNEPWTVVGVVKDVRWQGWDMEAPSIYGPFRLLAEWPIFNFLIRADGHAGQVLHDAAAAVAAADPRMRVVRAGMLEDLFVDSVKPRRLQSWLFGSFASAALAVVGVGILGLLAMSAARRTKEVGIRQALGATKGEIVRLFLRDQLAPVAVGLGVGGAIAAWSTQFIKTSLYGVTSSDLGVWAVAAGLMIGIAALGTIVPAIRASHVDPATVLRAE